MLLEGAAIALRSVATHKLRTVLTTLGNVVAVAALILIVAIVDGLNTSIERVLLARGADVFSVEQYPPAFSEEEWEAMKDNPPVTMEEAEAIRAESRLAGYVVVSDDRMATAARGDERVEGVEVRGKSEDYPYFEEAEIDAGRHFSAAEARERSPVAVLGSELAEKLFPQGAPLGGAVRLDGVPFTVIGVMKPLGTLLGMPRDNYAIVPIGSMERAWGRRWSVDVMVRPRSPAEMDACAEEVHRILRVKRHLRPREPDNFAVLAAVTYLNLYRNSTRTTYAALVGLVGLGLVVGGIVIANVMLMIVTERTREIGIRKALGAKRLHILWQFLAEAVTLSLVGGLLGLGIGAGVATLLGAVSPVPVRVAPWSVGLGIALVTVVGAAAGLYPAARASAMRPIDAMRYER